MEFLKILFFLYLLSSPKLIFFKSGRASLYSKKINNSQTIALEDVNGKKNLPIQSDSHDSSNPLEASPYLYEKNLKPSLEKEKKQPLKKLKKTKRKESEALWLYNQGVTELSQGREFQAKLFLEKAFYGYLFFPAYKALSSMGLSVSFIPFIWHFTLAVYGLFSLFLVWFLIAKKSLLKVKIKSFSLWILLLASLGVFKILYLKPQGRALKSSSLKSSPFEEAFSVGSLEKGGNFVALKREGGWIKVKSQKNQKGWTLKENLFFTRE